MGKSPLINRHVEWSKLLTILVLIPYGAVTIMALFLSAALFRRGEAESCVSIMQALLTFVAAPLAVAYGFYFWKARAENLVKCAKALRQSGVADEVTQEIINKE